MKICYISYYPTKRYPRQVQFIEALKRCNENPIILTNNKNGLLGYLEIIGKYIQALIRYDIKTLILGFRTTELFFPLYLLSIRKRIIYDCFVPLYPALKLENKWKLNRTLKRILSPLAYHYEKLQLKLSDTILTDTKSHADLIHKLYCPNKDIISIYLGNPISIQAKEESTRKYEKLKIFYYGTDQALHGTDLIIEAIFELSKTLDIQFTIIGKTPSYLNSLLSQSESIIHHRWKEQNSLFNEALNSDICIGGPFGNTFQSQNVITGKTFQFLSSGKCTLIGSNSETERFDFRDKENCLLIEQGSKAKLIKAIKWAYHNREKLDQIGKQGMALYERHFSKDKLITQILTQVISNSCKP